MSKAIRTEDPAERDRLRSEGWHVVGVKFETVKVRADIDTQGRNAKDKDVETPRAWYLTPPVTSA